MSRKTITALQGELEQAIKNYLEVDTPDAILYTLEEAIRYADVSSLEPEDRRDWRRYGEMIRQLANTINDYRRGEIRRLPGRSPKRR